MFVYLNTNDIIPFVDDFRVNTLLEREQLIINDEIRIKLELSIWLLETTIHNIRDKVTHTLLEYGTIYPEFIFEKLIAFSSSERLYIYERLASITYGICLRKQNDKNFITNTLKKYARTIFDLQFSSTPIAPSYHYIVIDSFKHIIDLAVAKKVILLNNEEEESLQSYNFFAKDEFKPLSDEIREKVNKIVSNFSDHSVDPLRGDFVTYTISRLLNDHLSNESVNQHLDATAHIYNKILELGYITRESYTSSTDDELNFYNGANLAYLEGKVDRLGKKYSWNAFFQYAGYLLSQNRLNSYYDGDSYVSAYYERLSDVELEASFPDTDKGFDIEEIYTGSLIAHKNNSPSWTEIEQYSEMKKVWNHKFINDEFTLLSGSIHDKPDDSYDVDSYLLVNSVLVKKQDIEGKESLIINRDYKWQKDLHTDGGTLSHVYFGELYWADTIPELKYSTEGVETEETEVVNHRLSSMDVFYGDKEYEGKKSGDIVQIKENKKVIFRSMPAVMDYLWETESNVYPHLRCDVPSPNMGKYLKLTSDAKNFRILDNEGKVAYKMIKHDYKKRKKQNLNYLRTDLLKKYLSDNNLVLMYQIKQHTFDRLAGDGSGDFRGMQFFFPEL
jgi:hypothetical protein